jgi:pimeloyl-ACP methyl ester carboxylesterase
VKWKWIKAACRVMLGVCVFLAACQSRLMYFPAPCRAEHRDALRAANGTALPFTTSQGKQTAFYIPPRDASAAEGAPIWVCCAGNGSLALDWLYFTPEWSPRFAYLLVDYPGYGDCEGSSRPDRIRENVLGAVTALSAHLKVPGQALKPRLRGLGHSLGSAAILMAATDLGMRQLVLIAPFTTMTDMARQVVGWPLCHLNHHRYDNRRNLARFVEAGGRARIFHGSDDEVIPVTMGRELAANHPGAVSFAEVAGAMHNDILSIAGSDIRAAMNESAR